MLKPWLIVFIIAIVPVSAHEFWLQPSSYTGKIGNEIAVDWRIGSHFEGTPYVYLPSMARQIAQINQDTRQELNPRFAAKPALTVTLGTGTTVVITESTDFEIKYANKAGFSTFLSKEHLQASVNIEDLPDGGEVIESYRRYAKALITLDNEIWQDQVVGLDYEWFISAREGQLTAQLLYLGKPAVGHPVKLFEQLGADKITERATTTDAQGRVTFDGMQTDGVYLLNAIRIQSVDRSSNEFNATWHSDWSSISFQWP